MIGSNSTALRQHAYSVFTASRRERETDDEVPASVLSPMSPSTTVPSTPARPGPQNAPGRVAEPKSTGVASVGKVVGDLSTPASAKQAEGKRAEPVKKAEAAQPPTHDEIGRRAHEIFEARNGQAGDPVADWLRAEAELRQERGLA
ncbi:MAG: DUF2934 domain-containing protein [Phycisphaerales bacterium JB064]